MGKRFKKALELSRGYRRVFVGYRIPPRELKFDDNANYRARVTVCLLVRGDVVVSRGMAIHSNGSTHNRRLGRKIAEGRAMAMLQWKTRLGRGQPWRAWPVKKERPGAVLALLGLSCLSFKGMYLPPLNKLPERELKALSSW